MSSKGVTYRLKSRAEIEAMRAAGEIVWRAHQVAASLVKPGVSTAEINEAVETFLAEQGAAPLFKGVPGPVPYPAATCISLNEQIVHGIPGKRRLQEGDLVSIDIGCRLDGWCGDAAVTHAVGQIDARARRLLQVTEGALHLAIELLGRKSRWAEVAQAMEQAIRQAGFTIFEQLIGHGIGREMWEPPQVPNFYHRGMDFPLRPGLVIAVEPMVGMGGKEIRLLPDHWTIVTADGSLSAHFEHTIALTEDGPQVLTTGSGGLVWG
ncbi:type I methionyl aminopeptidase [Thermogemmatispora sp.]|uniref:type I methionyl aminopeptidase n=1 Tax=Thermogemmatispora sp. TaxID=1968838 RepID=UPI0035E3F815